MQSTLDRIGQERALPAERDRGRPPGARKPWLRDTALYLALIALSALFALPFAWLISTSLKPPAEVFSDSFVGSDIHFKNYQDVFRNAPVGRWLLNSTIVAVLGVVSVLFSSSLAAYGFSRLRFPGRNKLFALVIATYMLPSAATMIPTFLIWNEIGAVNTFFPLWAGNLFGSAFYIFMLRQFMFTIPQDFVDAARIDGASYIRIYWNIILPLVAPALAAVAVFEFQAKWNDFMTPLIYLNDPNKYTMSLGLASFKTDFEMQWALWMAASVIFTVPMVILFFIAQRYFIEASLTSGIKG